MPGLVKILQGLLPDIGDVAGYVFLTQFGVAGHDFKLLDMDRGKDIVRDNPLRDQNRILKIIAIPRHKGAEDIATQGQFAQVRSRDHRQ